MPLCAKRSDILAEQGRPLDYMRIRGFPFDADRGSISSPNTIICYVVEQNRDAQLSSLLILETPVSKEKIRPVLVYGGFPLSARHVLDAIGSSVEELNALYR